LTAPLCWSLYSQRHQSHRAVYGGHLPADYLDRRRADSGQNHRLLIFWVLLVMAIMSWVSQGRSPVEYALIQLAEPLLRRSAACCLRWAASTFRR
jgi:hypothetical protein